MAFKMDSKTKVEVSEIKIKEIIKKHFNQEVVFSKEIVSGFYNAIYYIETATQKLVLKVAPSNDINILTYEHHIMERETKVYRLLEEVKVPVPKVLIEDYTKSIISSNFYIMTFLEGNTLFELRNSIEDKEPIYNRLMEYLADIHMIEMETFGYDNFDSKTYNLQDAYLKMLNNMVKDAIRADLELPEYVLELLDLAYEFSIDLDYDDEPVLLHFDLWDGNIFLSNNEIVGLIDTERSLNGEPMMEFVAMHWDIFSEDIRKYIEHYNSFTNKPIILNEETKIRYRLYQVYMYLLIVVECPYRDVNGSFDEQKEWGLHELKKLHTFFKDKV